MVRPAAEGAWGSLEHALHPDVRERTGDHVLISGITPQLRTTDLDATIRFYVEKVGLTLGFRYSDFYAGLRAGDQSLHLKLVCDTDPSHRVRPGR